MSRTQLSTEVRARGARLAQALRARRVELGMSREELARRTEWSVYTLASLEAGRIPTPGFFVVADLTRELDLDLQELVQEIEEEVDG